MMQFNAVSEQKRLGKALRDAQAEVEIATQRAYKVMGALEYVEEILADVKAAQASQAAEAKKATPPPPIDVDPSVEDDDEVMVTAADAVGAGNNGRR